MSEREAPIATLLRGAVLSDGGAGEVLIEAGGRVSGTGSRLAVPLNAIVIDLDGFVLLPALVEPHAHLDKAFTAARVPNPTGDLLGAVAAWLAARPSIGAEDLVTRIREAALLYAAAGTLAIRTHIDVGDGVGLRAILAADHVRRELAHLVSIEIVALCSLPVTGRQGAENRALVAAAIDAGADLVGGAPWLDEHPDEALDLLARLGADHRLPLDLHVDEALDPQVTTIRSVARLARDGYPAPVTASHCVSLGLLEPAEQAALAEELSAAGVAVVALPQTNLYLQARHIRSATPRGLTAVQALLDAGVLVAAGGDNLRDPFNPLGRADPLEAASLLVAVGHVGPDEALAAVGVNGRRLLGLPPAGFEVGDAADFVAVRASSAVEAVAGAPAERVVIRRGEVIARTEVTRWFAASTTADRSDLAARLPATTPAWATRLPAPGPDGPTRAPAHASDPAVIDDALDPGDRATARPVVAPAPPASAAASLEADR